MSTRAKGFTLIELMIVVAIIGVLMSLTLPSYQQYTVKTQLSEAVQMSMSFKNEVANYYNQYQKMPANNLEAGLPEPELLIGNYVTSVTIKDGAIHILLGNKINQNLQGRTISLQPFTVAGSPKSPIAWGCGYAKPPNGMSVTSINNTDVDRYYLPIQCRI